MTGEDRTLTSDTGTNINDIYSFRALDRLLECGFQELERQTIYFAPPEDLNDPLESIREMYWNHGDMKVWRMVFTKFLTWFDQLEVYGHGENTTPSSVNKDNDIPLRKTELSKIDKNFISHLATTCRNLSRDEMRTILHKVYTDLLAARNIRGYSRIDFQLTEYLQALAELETRGNANLMNTVDLFHARYGSGAILNSKRGTLEREIPEENIDLTYIPELFLENCERSIFPNYYVACFTSTYSDPTMWAHYAKGHSGACLVFGSTSKENKRYLGNFKTNSDDRHQLREVKYLQILEPIDVLDAISALNRFRKALIAPIDIRFWPQTILSDFRDRIVTKTTEWQREGEFRLVWEDKDRDRNRSTHLAPRQRLVKYEFDTLKGIIFGVKTTDLDKLRIMRVIDRKCSEQHRSDFKYFQAYVDKGRIEKHEIHLEGR